MPHKYRCTLPCDRSFPTPRALVSHRLNKPICRVRWDQFLADLAPYENQQLSEDEDQDMLPDNPPAPGPPAMTLCVDDNDNDNDSLNEWSEEDLAPLGTRYDVEPEPRLGEPEATSAFVEYFLGSGQIIDHEDSPFDEWRQDIGQMSHSRYYPFAGEKEWAVACWLHESGLSLEKINRFLHLQYVLDRPFSFRSGAALHDRIEQMLFRGPKWQAKSIRAPQGTVAEPIVLFYRDPIACIKYLLARPSLEEYMNFQPEKLYSDEDEDERQRIFGEMTTGDWWWNEQGTLPAGATLIPVLLGSDSTHLTNFAGGKQAWPVYMSIGNIEAKARNRPSKKAWMLLGYIPHSVFLDHKLIRGTLLNRLFHHCMKIITNPLIAPGTHGMRMTDSNGDVRLCYPRVAVHLADYPEQCLVNVASRFSSPNTTAGYSNLDDSETHPPRSREWVLERIRSICNDFSPYQIKTYQKAARAMLLNGVHEPYWEHLPGFYPELAAAPDILHGAIRGWRDHILQWSRDLIGVEEYDLRLRSVQRVPGYRSFSSGIEHLSQFTGREDRELQRVHLAIMANHPKVTRRLLQCLRAFHDFLYLIQYLSHSEMTLEYLDKAHTLFSDTKWEFIRLGVRKGQNGVINHFKIPKFYALRTFTSHIRHMGSSPQFSTEIIESLHRQMAKEPYKHTNRRDFATQMVRRLDRQERMDYHQEFVDWCVEDDIRRALTTSLARYSPEYREQAVDWHVSSLRDPQESQRVSDHIEQSTLWLSNRPHHAHVEMNFIVQLYSLWNFPTTLLAFLHAAMTDADHRLLARDLPLRVATLDVWHKLRIRASDVQDENRVSQAHSIEAFPPSTDRPYGSCHCVLIRCDDNAQSSGVEGYRVAQVRLLFRVHLEQTDSSLHKGKFAYIQWFSKFKRLPERDINMYVVSRMEDESGARIGEIVPLESIARFVQLIPKFEDGQASTLTAENSMETGNEYYVNSFADKEIYQSVW